MGIVRRVSAAKGRELCAFGGVQAVGNRQKRGSRDGMMSETVKQQRVGRDDGCSKQRCWRTRKSVNRMAVAMLSMKHWHPLGVTLRGVARVEKRRMGCGSQNAGGASRKETERYTKPVGVGEVNQQRVVDVLSMLMGHRKVTSFSPVIPSRHERSGAGSQHC